MTRSSMASPAALRLYLLGSFRLEGESKTISLPTRKVESLLAYLALFPEQHTREKLAALLWGDVPDAQARHSLRTALAAIRKGLGEEILIADRGTVRLDPDAGIWVDAQEFEQAAESRDPIILLSSAIGNYRDLLPDCYDDWIIRERERLRLLYLDALLQLAQYHRAKSEYAKTIELAQKVFATDHANEKAHQHLMVCYTAQGDRIAALKQYDECKKLLREELNAEPSAETKALRDQIMADLTGAQSPEAALTNLPNPLTSFVGREKEIKELKELMPTTRLLTLSGAGGCGKTRLAIQVARGFVDEFKQGIWWIELAALTDESLVPHAVAQVLGMQGSPQRPMAEMLTLSIRDKRLLLVLDTCEHLVKACAELTEKLLLACPNLKIIATSQEPLKLPGEIAWRVPCLRMPNVMHLPPVENLGSYDAIQLFVQRASAVAPNWKLSANARAVAQICARLDGIPLAIELAAARLQVLSIDQIAALLDDRFRLLTEGTRTALPRQQTLRATIDWSYQLLEHSERTLLQRFSVFAGGWTLEAAESVCSGDSIDQKRILDLLTKLVDKSLVVASLDAAARRYHMLETIQQYAREKLKESGETLATQNRHAEFFLQLAEQAESKLKSAEQKVWSDRLEHEHDNLRAAFKWAMDNDVEVGLRLAWPIRMYWIMRGYLIEGREWADTIIDQTERLQATASRARAFNLAGFLANRQRDYKLGHVLSEKALELARSSGSKPEIAFALNQVGISLNFLGKSESARPFFEESLEIFRELDDVWAVAFSLFSLGNLARQQGNYELAQSLFEEITAILRMIGDRFSMRHVFNQLGEIARSNGDYQLAAAFYEESVEVERAINGKITFPLPLGNWAWVSMRLGDLELAVRLAKQCLTLSQEQCNIDSLTLSMAELAEVMGVRGKPEQGAKVLGAVEAAREAAGVPMAATDRVDYEHTVATVRAHLDSAAFNAAWAEGRTMALDPAVEYALENVK